ncbi:prenyltransferase/squalene oxidase repeat-containing protein [Microbispora hainanensis]|uniref:prenyltransferase/squalene oxidase repeat-containing protein n=1 Tax=Microbispora hainanensis TaxID=568844 RepID=UPI0033DE7132
MSVGGLTYPKAIDVAAAAAELVTDLMVRPWGTVSPSVYETGRLVSLAPWLVGHAERVRFLVDCQRPDGSWGGPEGYSLVPTLSATEALLCALTRGEPDDEKLATAAGRGLDYLLGWPPQGTASMFPDMPAIELIVPALVELVNAHLDTLAERDVPRLAGRPRLRLPAGMNDRVLAAVRSRVGSGAELPQKLMHALEVAGAAAHGAPGVQPTSIGTVGASPAATAAWLGGRALPDHGTAARRHLEAVARRYGGPVPVGLPITVFERGWVLSWLARAGIPFDVPPEMLADLRAAIQPVGTPAGAGLPPDADTTSVALYALALLGMPFEPGSLWAFRTDTHFCTWQGEEGASVSVNAHVLDALGEYAKVRPEAAGRYRPDMDAIGAWLCERQQPEGWWDDRWHASPYYATVSCALALDAFGGAGCAPSVRRAVRWVLETQRADGSWGRWGGTREETAYAMQLLLLTGEDELVAEAAARGYDYLLRAGEADDPPLWHDKDLYLPAAVVRAAILAALHLAQSSGLVVDRHRQV